MFDLFQVNTITYNSKYIVLQLKIHYHVYSWTPVYLFPTTKSTTKRSFLCLSTKNFPNPPTFCFLVPCKRQAIGAVVGHTYEKQICRVLQLVGLLPAYPKPTIAPFSFFEHPPRLRPLLPPSPQGKRYRVVGGR
ncbi:hypothetical protein CDAR_441401 [Caerostris darwini]|uniref:Uncharacterized protein n=1 Tax=Caerostris darwini TaxID=1538125 RepID=A0AAV4TQ31_9ARAC|nr:hypothetical protein CDAR_441401 [Caerostris darwini]